jgi:hypothetical protein
MKRFNRAALATAVAALMTGPCFGQAGVSAGGKTEIQAGGALNGAVNGNGASTGALSSGGGTVHFGFDQTTSPELESDRARTREQDRVRAKGQAESRMKAQSQAGTRDGNDRSIQGSTHLDVQAGAKARAGDQGDVDANGRAQAGGAASGTTR